MSDRSPWWTRAILVVATMLVGACASPGASGTTPGVSGEPISSPLGSSPAVASQPAGAASPSAEPSVAAEPPAASLSAEGGDPVVGELGSNTWHGAGSDSPWLQGSPIRVGASEPLTVTIAGAPAVG